MLKQKTPAEEFSAIWDAATHNHACYDKYFGRVKGVLESLRVPQSVLEHVAGMASKVITRSSNTQGVRVAFRHTTFQEYFSWKDLRYNSNMSTLAFHATEKGSIVCSGQFDPNYPSAQYVLKTVQGGNVKRLKGLFAELPPDAIASQDILVDFIIAFTNCQRLDLSKMVLELVSPKPETAQSTNQHKELL